MPMSGPSLLIVFVNNNNPPAGTTATFGGVAMRQAPDRAFELNVAANASGNVVASAPGFVPATFFVNMAGQPFHVQPITIWEEPNLVIHVTCDLRGTPIANAKATKTGAKNNKTPTSLSQKLFGTAKAPQTAQQSIPYRAMYRDGICRITDRLYTKTIIFGDINYQLAQNEDKSAIFEAYCDFLNYFDSTIHIQLSFVNKYGNLQDFERSIDIPDQRDEFNSIRREYADMLKSQLSKGNNGLVKQKHITFGIEADSLREAKPRLERIELDIINNFKMLGVPAWPLDGHERLEVIHGQLHPDGMEKLHFDWRELPKTGLSTKDYIAPTSFDFRDKKTFRMGQTIGATSFVQIIAPELTDKLLADFLNMENAITVNMHIKSIDQAAAIKMIKRKITDLDAMKITEQKKAVRAGYDFDIIPTDIATYGDEAKNILKELQSRNERMFLVTIIILNTAPTKQRLDNQIFATAGIAQKYNCALKRLDFQQEQGLMSSLPLGLNQIEIQRGLTTSSTAIFVPFTTQELFQEGRALYYGLNALSNNLIMADRRKLKNPKGVYCQGRSRKAIL